MSEKPHIRVKIRHEPDKPRPWVVTWDDGSKTRYEMVSLRGVVMYMGDMSGKESFLSEMVVYAHWYGTRYGDRVIDFGADFDDVATDASIEKSTCHLNPDAKIVDAAEVVRLAVEHLDKHPTSGSHDFLTCFPGAQ